MGILVVGSIALDNIKTPFGEISEGLGGSATYFSIAASYFTDVSLVAVVGTDFPREHIELLRSRGIDLEGLVQEEGKTFRYSGEYGYDLNDRDTLETHLNVFEGFRPSIPESLASSEYVFLGNIDPALQGQVLDQVSSPRFSALDTMNFYIEGRKEELLKTISRVDAVVMNDSECRQLTDEPNLILAARKVLEMGPRSLVIKKGEHGALMFSGQDAFSAPAFPCESVLDPTGAGDAFAGGFMGHIASTGDVSPDNLRKAVIYGTVMASFCVESFSVMGIFDLDPADIEARLQALKDFSHFEA